MLTLKKMLISLSIVAILGLAVVAYAATPADSSCCAAKAPCCQNGGSACCGK
ncbi:MAG: hypothetical protein WCP79_12355 [Bacillota bacterium]